MILDLPTDIIFILIGALSFIAVICFVSFIAPYKARKNTKRKLEKIAKENNFTFSEVYKKEYDYQLENEEVIFQFKLVMIPENSSVTINNRFTWCLRWGGSKKKLGRLYPNRKYLTEVSNFLSLVTQDKKKTVKVVILYKDTEKIVMYLNESELAMVSAKDTPYGYKVITYKDLEEKFPDLL